MAPLPICLGSHLQPVRAGRSQRPAFLFLGGSSIIDLDLEQTFRVGFE